MNGVNDKSIISVTFICNRLWYIFICIAMKFVLLLKQCLILELGLVYGV